MALIAGQGLYPMLIAQSIRRAGIPLRLIAFEEETRPDLFESVPESDRKKLLVGQLGKMLKALEHFGAGSAIMAGQITPRRLFKGLHPDLKAARILFSLKRRNAETIFGAIAAEIEQAGVRMLDARAFLDDHLATPGPMTGFFSAVSAEERAFGLRMAQEMARLDVGQAVVTAKGTVIAVEAFEGTDNMLRRCAATGGKEMLLTKTAKHAQDWRFDVPCFGLRTLESMAEGGVRRATLQVDGVIMIDKPAVLARAKELGLYLEGVDLSA